MRKSFIVILLIVASSACTSQASQTTAKEIASDTIAQTPETPHFPTKVDEISVPEGYMRIPIEDSASFAFYLRHLPLKPEGTPVYSYDGYETWTFNYAYAVIDSIDTGKEDIQQCADAVIRLRAEWLFKNKRYSDIAFHFTNGWLCDYTHWADGYRVSVKGNKTSWYQASQRDYSYKTFRKYLDMIFNYAGTLSLSKELKSVKLQDMQIGDVFIIGGSPGHAIIVIDMAENPETKDKCFVVAESYMPAQDIHILKNESRGNYPWYFVNDFVDENGCSFPTYWYSTDCLKRF